MKKKRPKPVVLSSDSESEDDSKKNLNKNKKPLAKKPARQVLSDSGMAILIAFCLFYLNGFLVFSH